jgi:RNA polymerase primary sigma factor
MRLGLDGREGLTRKEVGRRFRVTRERNRQLEYWALGQLRRATAKNERPTASGRKTVSASA